MGKDFAKLRAVFISHMHHDHVGGLPQLIGSLDLSMVEPDHQLTCLLPAEGKYPFLNWLQALHLPLEKIRFELDVTGVALSGLPTNAVGTVEPVYEDEYAKVTAMPTGHMGPCAGAFSYIFDILDKRIAFSGDLPHDFRHLGDLLAEPLDVLVMEMEKINAYQTLSMKWIK